MSDRVALITGITGQDGAFLAELLLKKGYIVHGIKRRSSSFNTDRIDHLYQDPHELHRRLVLHYGDLTDATNLIRVVEESNPTEIYNLAAQAMFSQLRNARYTANADAIGALRILEAMRILKLRDRTRFLPSFDIGALRQGQRDSAARDDALLSAQSLCCGQALRLLDYGELQGSLWFHASNGILFNHEGPTRGETFVTRKITRAVAAIELGRQKTLYLGNLGAKRDWAMRETTLRGCGACFSSR